jgi:hypothetical protein
MTFLASAAALGLASLITAAHSSAANHVSRLTPVNTPTQFYFQSFRRACVGVAPWNLARAATVVVPEHPAHGTLEIRSGQAPVVKCQNRPGFATIVTYTPEHNYAGADNFQLRVLYQLLGRTDSRALNVHVEIGRPR